MMVVQKPNTDKIDMLIKQNDSVQKKLDDFIEQYADIKSSLRINNKDHEELFRRIEKIENDLEELRKLIQSKGDKKDE